MIVLLVFRAGKGRGIDSFYLGSSIPRRRIRGTPPKPELHFITLTLAQSFQKCQWSRFWWVFFFRLGTLYKEHLPHDILDNIRKFQLMILQTSASRARGVQTSETENISRLFISRHTFDGQKARNPPLSPLIRRSVSVLNAIISTTAWRVSGGSRRPPHLSPL